MSIFADDFDEMFEFFGLGDKVTSVPPKEKVFNENTDFNISVRLKKLTYSQNNLQFDFTIQNKENNDMECIINMESIIIKNEKDKILKLVGENFSKNINKDLDYFSVIALEDQELSDFYEMIVPIEFNNTKIAGKINFLFNNISIK